MTLNSLYKQGAKFKHHKGGLYTIVAMAKHEALGTDMVVYQGSDGAIWVRPLTEFRVKFEPVAHSNDVVQEPMLLCDVFENWHSKTNQFKKYKLSHSRAQEANGRVTYHDNRTQWAFIAFMGGYQAAEFRNQEGTQND